MNAEPAVRPLDNARAFAALREVLAGSAPPTGPVAEPAFARLIDALHRGPRPSPLDLAVLVRQALRYESERTRGQATLWVPTAPGWPEAADWARVGIDAIPDRTGYRLAAHPWRPSWLANSAGGVDAAAAGELERRAGQPVAGDPFLSRFVDSTGPRTTYRSAGQRAAVRAALTMPPGGTLLVCLPTSDGKSFIFQIVAELGFGDDTGQPGVTLVITPTVALALDQELAARAVGLPPVPRAYRGGDPAGTNGELAAAIEAGTQGLCFASPEAVCGALLRPLLRAAESGFLRAVVLDEAHLVDSWGATFRPEFQLLSGVRRALVQAAGPGPAPRTILLSATLTSETVSTLRTLFADGDGPDRFGIVSAARLRPEIEYWAASPAREDERRNRVLEAVLHAPRPAILYVTERRDADRWFRVLQETGFSRLARVTGDSSPAEREAAVEGWRAGTVDLVVGTSAFGLGIDNPHVRTIIHACVPETLDRFYQEVGRGGRDGRAALSLTVPAELDEKTARGLSKRRLLSIDVGLRRWQAMFEDAERVSHGEGVFTVRLDAAPDTDETHIDMVSGQSTDWNSRTLTLMAGAGLIRLLGRDRPAEFSPPEDDELLPAAVAGPPRPVQRLRILEPAHLDPELWEERVEPHRQALELASRDSLRRMLDHPRARTCVADNLAPLYHVDATESGGPAIRVARACGGCPACRVAGIEPYEEAAPEPRHPWPALAPAAAAARLLDEFGRLLVYYPPALADAHAAGGGERRRQRRRLHGALARLLAWGFRAVLAPPGGPVDAARLAELAPHRPFFLANEPREILPGPALLVLPPGFIVTRRLLAARPGGGERVLLLPDDTPDPDQPATLLRERANGKHMDLESFLLWMNP